MPGLIVMIKFLIFAILSVSVLSGDCNSYNPVCGANNVTYQNVCKCQEARVDVGYYGVCRVSSEIEWVKKPEEAKNMQWYSWQKPAEKKDDLIELKWNDYSWEYPGWNEKGCRSGFSYGCGQGGNSWNPWGQNNWWGNWNQGQDNWWGNWNNGQNNGWSNWNQGQDNWFQPKFNDPSIQPLASNFFWRYPDLEAASKEYYPYGRQVFKNRFEIPSSENKMNSMADYTYVEEPDWRKINYRPQFAAYTPEGNWRDQSDYQRIPHRFDADGFEIPINNWDRVSFRNQRRQFNGPEQWQNDEPLLIKSPDAPLPKNIDSPVTQKNDVILNGFNLSKHGYKPMDKINRDVKSNLAQNIFFGPQVQPDYSWMSQYTKSDQKPLIPDNKGLPISDNNYDINIPDFLVAPKKQTTVKFDQLNNVKPKLELDQFLDQNSGFINDNKYLINYKKDLSQGKFGSQWLPQQPQAFQFKPQTFDFNQNAFAPQQTGKLNTIQTSWSLLGPQGIQGSSTGGSLVGAAM